MVRGAHEIIRRQLLLTPGMPKFSYVQGLEERVAYLQERLQLQEESIQSVNHPRATISPPTTSTQHLEDWAGQVPAETESPATSQDETRDAAAVGMVDAVRDLTQRTPEPESSFSKVFLSELVSSQLSQRQPRRQSTSKQDGWDDLISADIIGNLDRSPISLPPKSAAQKVVRAYFKCASLGAPLLHEPTFRQHLDLLYDMPTTTINIAETHTSTESRLAVFFVLEVLAIGLLSMHKLDPSRVPIWVSDRYHKTAIDALTEVGLPNSVDGVEALLLIGIFSYNHPTRWAFLKTVGAALRFAVELGLHQEATLDKSSFLALDRMRRTFWVAYAMERNIAISLRIPSSLSDGVVTTKARETVPSSQSQRPPNANLKANLSFRVTSMMSSSQTRVILRQMHV